MPSSMSFGVDTRLEVQRDELSPEVVRHRVTVGRQDRVRFLDEQGRGNVEGKEVPLHFPGLGACVAPLPLCPLAIKQTLTISKRYTRQ